MPKITLPANLEQHDPADRALYHLWITDRLRYNDLDPVGHVNNNAVGQFVENGRVRLFDEIGRDPAVPGQAMRLGWVVRRLEVDFIKEIRFPGDVEVGTRVVRIGTSSMIVRSGIFVEGACACTATTVSVCFDMIGRTSMPIPEDIRAKVLRASEGTD